MTDTPRRLTRRHAIGFVATGVAAAGITAAVARLAWRPRAETASTVPAATATVTRRTLVDVRTMPGTLAYGAEHDVESTLEGTVTWLPDVGAVIDRGDTLMRVDDAPVVLLYGTLPAYRDLAENTQGADVSQLEQNLQALGYKGFTADRRFTAPTTTAVRRWQERLGLEDTGTVELGRVFYAPGSIRIASQRLTVGKRIAGPVLTFTATARMVTARLRLHEQELARKGTQVTIALSNGTEVAGVIESARTSQPSADGGLSAEPGIETQISLTDPSSVSGVDDGPVNVRFVVEEREDVLVVPVAALLALAEGGYGLEVVEGQNTRVIAVTTGLFANGNVEVSGAGLAEGMVVGSAT